MNTIRIVRGNSFYLHIPIVKCNIGSGGTEQVAALPISSLTDVEASLINTYGEKKTLEWKTSGSESSIIIAHVDGDIPCGNYSLQITGKLEGEKKRSYSNTTLEIVQSNEESNIYPGKYEEEDDYTTPYQIIPGFVWVGIGTGTELRMTFDMHGDWLITEGETKHISSIIRDASGANVTNQFTVWGITRTTTDTYSDKAWNASATSRVNSDGTFDLKYADIGSGQHALFTVTAKTAATDVNMVSKVIEI